MREPHERFAQTRHRINQDAGDPQSQAEGHQIAALQPVLVAGMWDTYERERRQRPALRKRDAVQTGGK